MLNVWGIIQWNFTSVVVLYTTKYASGKYMKIHFVRQEKDIFPLFSPIFSLVVRVVSVFLLTPFLVLLNYGGFFSIPVNLPVLSLLPDSSIFQMRVK